MIDAFDKLAPADADYRHNAEGSDDMVFTAFLGLFRSLPCLISIPSLSYFPSFVPSHCQLSPF